LIGIYERALVIVILIHWLVEWLCFSISL